MKEIWGIIGLGWLGTELAIQLKAIGRGAWGTHRASFDFAKSEIPDDPCDILFLNTPPLADVDPRIFVARIEKTRAARILFVSSTSVYGNTSGIFDETTAVYPSTDSARWLVGVEALLRESFDRRVTILRAGGLIGGERHPVKALSGKTNVACGNHSINLIHRKDLIGIALATAAHGPIEIVNAVSPFHPHRSAYYSGWAEKLGLRDIEFEQSDTGDRVIQSKILPALYPNWKCRELNFL